MQKLLICIAALLALSGCAHKIDVQQGNIISLDTLNKVQIGMDQEQVRYILGTPLLTDPFHQNRWDYYYSMQKEGKVTSRYGATLYFSGKTLERIEKYGPIPATAVVEESPPSR